MTTSGFVLLLLSINELLSLRKCYFGHAYSYSAAILELHMKVCSIISGNLNSRRCSVCCLCYYWKLGFFCYYAYNLHTITFYLILVVDMTLGLWGAQADVLPLLLNKQSILQSNYFTIAWKEAATMWRLSSSPRQLVTGQEMTLRCSKGRFRFDIRKNFFTGRVVKHWNWLLRGLVRSPAVEVFKKWLDMKCSALV